MDVNITVVRSTAVNKFGLNTVNQGRRKNRSPTKTCSGRRHHHLIASKTLTHNSEKTREKD